MQRRMSSISFKIQALSLIHILGNLMGSHFALKKGARFIRPMMLVVLVLLLGKLISDAVL